MNTHTRSILVALLVGLLLSTAIGSTALADNPFRPYGGPPPGGVPPYYPGYGYPYHNHQYGYSYPHYNYRRNYSYPYYNYQYGYNYPYYNYQPNYNYAYSNNYGSGNSYAYVNGFGPVPVEWVTLTTGQTVVIPAPPYNLNMPWGTFGSYANWAAQFQWEHGRPPGDGDLVGFWISQAAAGVLSIQF